MNIWLGVFLLQYFPLVKMWKILHYTCINMYSWVVKIRNISEAVLRPHTARKVDFTDLCKMSKCHGEVTKY